MKRHFSICTVLVLLIGVLLPFEGHGATISYQYDRLNRLTSVKYGDGLRIAYAYDPVGNRLSITPAAGALKGDLDGNNLVNLIDAIQGLQVVSASKPAGIRSDYAGSGADVGGNQKIDIEEVVYILQEAAGLR